MNDRRQYRPSFLLTSLSRSAPLGEACWQPSVDVYRGRNCWLVKFDLAGIRAEDIQVLLDGSRLTVRGTRRDWTITEGQQAYSMEISYNCFERSIELPLEDVGQVRFESEYRDGMFLVKVTLQPSAQRDE